MSYTATIETNAMPDRVLAVLTEPDAIRRWSPVPFELDGRSDQALAPGTEAKVSGKLAGIRVGFDVRVHAADPSGVRLRAEGPISLDVAYGLRPLPTGSEPPSR